MFRVDTARIPLARSSARRLVVRGADLASHDVDVARRVPRHDHVGSRPEGDAGERDAGACLQDYTGARGLSATSMAPPVGGAAANAPFEEMSPLATGRQRTRWAPRRPQRTPRPGRRTSRARGVRRRRGERADFVVRAPEHAIGSPVVASHRRAVEPQPVSRRCPSGLNDATSGMESRSSRSGPASRSAATVLPEAVSTTANPPARTTSATVPSGLRRSTSPSPGSGSPPFVRHTSPPTATSRPSVSSMGAALVVRISRSGRRWRRQTAVPCDSPGYLKHPLTELAMASVVPSPLTAAHSTFLRASAGRAGGRASRRGDRRRPRRRRTRRSGEDVLPVGGQERVDVGHALYSGKPARSGRSGTIARP